MITEELPLSYAQQRLWFLDQFEPNSALYNVPAALRLEGTLDRVALEKSLSEIIERHEVLRTNFAVVDGQPTQIIHTETTWNLSVVDLQHLSTQESEIISQQLLQKQGLQPFDLTSESLIRATLIVLSPDEHILLVCMHHIVSDGWSTGVFVQELSALYNAYTQGQPSPLSPLPIQYADFAIWQREWLQGEVLQRQLNYWQEKLKDAPALLELPTDRPRPPVQTFIGSNQRFALSPELSQKLTQLSQETGATLFMTLLAAFNTLLYRYTGQSDILVGTPIANRNHSEIQGLIGFFVNTLVMRTDLSGNPSFNELLSRVRETAMEAYTYQDLPFEMLVEALQPERNLSHTPLFQVMFAFQNAPVSELELGGLTLSSIEIENPIAKFDLNLAIASTPEGLAGVWEYNTDLFDDSTILRMTNHLLTLLESIVANAQAPISQLPILTAAEQHQLLIEWNNTQTPLGELGRGIGDREENHSLTPNPYHLTPSLCLHQLFEQQVEKTPDAIAVVFENQHLTYSQLNEKANQLAHYLRSLGVGAQVLVGICVQRSLEMVVGILGILKAGGAYLPLDPDYPIERLSFILEDSGTSVLLIQSFLSDKLSSINLEPSPQIICLDQATFNSELKDNPVSLSVPADLAYVIYTSGSTGTPKGVMIEHRAIVNLSLSWAKTFQVQSMSRLLQFGSFSFDLSVGEIATSLVSGASLYLTDKETLLPSQNLVDFLAQNQITHSFLSPSALSVLPQATLPHLQYLTVGGEACPPGLASFWGVGRQFYNCYGPTESTVTAAVALIQPDGKKPPIGKPLSNLRIYILDAYNQPLPVGIPGELCIAGVGLARGYLNRPDLTSEKFIEVELGGKRERIYKTGDLARYLPDGNLEYLGRIDNQVKIRGFRIELGEVETALSQLPEVQTAVVVAREDEPNKKRLVAYIVPQEKNFGSSNKLEDSLTDKAELLPSVAEFYVYDDLLYYAMTNDHRRNNSYQVAINKLVKDKIVVEIGTGKDAILARFCVAGGAKKIYAIELNEETCHKARACVEKLGLADKIIVIHGDATVVNLPELADVCVSEIVGSIGGSEGATVIINNSRRLLKPDGLMIPERSVTKMAAVTLPDEILHNPQFAEIGAHYAKEIFKQVGYPFDLRVCIKKFPKSNVLSTVDVLEDLNFNEYVSPDFTHEIKLEMQKNGRMDGFLVWLNLHTIAGEEIDILEHEHCWLPIYFPVFEPGIEVEQGDIIQAVCYRTLCDNNLNPDYAIKGSLLKKNGQKIDFEYFSYHYKNNFRQTPFYQRLFANYDQGETNQSDNLVPSLRANLKKILPDYMIPSNFVVLENLPLTPNGKVDYRALPMPESRSGIEANLVAPGTPVEEILATIWQEVLKVDPIGIHDNFFELGGDSILSIQIVTKARQAGLQLTVNQLFAHQTIAELAAVAGTTKVIQIAQELVTGKVHLTPIQQRFFELKWLEPHHFNQSFLFTTPSEFQPELLSPIWEKLLQHHDALRLRFTQSESGWEQIHATPTKNIAISCFDLSSLPESEIPATIENTANSLQASLNLASNLVQVAHFKLGEDKEGRLLIVIHHLVVDGVSWRILIEDLLTAYQQLSQSQAIQLPPKTTSFQDWAQQLTTYAQSEILKLELAYWLPKSDTNVSPLPVDYPAGENTVASASNICVSLNEAETQALLQEVPKAYKTQINDVLLTALVLVLSRWTNSNSVRFNLEGHGREDIIEGVDLSRTVGWFTTLFPVQVELEETDNLGTILKSVKEQLRKIPHKGIGYGLLRYLCDDPEVKSQVQKIKEAEINFNYLGQFGQALNQSSVFQLATESTGNSLSLQGQRSGLLDVNAAIAASRLHIDWIYSSNVHDSSTIEKIATDFVTTLRELIAHCLSPENGGYTPSDFPLIKLTQPELDRVLASLPLTNWQNIEDIYPLSPMQQGMLFESLYAPDSGVYVEQMTSTLTGNLNVSAFEQAWQQLVAHHSIFRTAFVWESLEQPVQVLYRQIEVKVERLDWRELSAVEQEQQLQLFLDSKRQQGFDFGIAPLLRLYLIQCSEITYEFVWSFHHILMDGWSLPLVFQDLLNCYQAIVLGQSLDYQPALNYRHYIAWLQQQEQKLAEEFWRNKLQGFAAPTPLMVDKPIINREKGSRSYREQQIGLSVSATEKAVSFVRENQLTLSNLVQTTWALLLSRYSQETDVVFGATVSGRPAALAGVESMVGLFINTLPMRVQLGDRTELLGLLKDLQAQLVESEQFSYSSLVEIQGWSDVKRGTALFESILVFENYPVNDELLEENQGLSFSNLRTIEQTNYPLTILVGPGKQLLLKVYYDGDRFDDDAISRMLGHFVTLLEAIVANPQTPIAQLPMLTAAEQHQLLIEWNNTQTPLGELGRGIGDREENHSLTPNPYHLTPSLCLHQLFEQQVEKTPDAVAVVFENQQLTYRELNAKANQLAHYLRSLGVGADIPVGICVERSREMLVGVLGILKAGGAYVPIDPEYPTERLSLMLSDSQVSVLLTQQKFVETLYTTSLPTDQAHLVCLDTDWSEISQHSPSNLICDVQPENLAYVIYTSGSTGKPKGIAMNHLPLVNLMLWQVQNSTIAQGGKTLQFAPISFDVSCQEMFSTWCSGGTLLLISEQLRREPEALLDLLSQQAVERLFLPFVGLQQLAEVAMESQSTVSLREIITAGEQLQMTPAITQWLNQLSNCTLHNHYGPSESHVVTSFTVNQTGESWSLLPPIGKPIANSQIYILDRSLQPVPIGVPGELHIGGVSLARGYLNRPELTSEKFIDNPFGDRGQVLGCREEEFPQPLTPTPQPPKLYKTGDLARYLPDGNIEYLGRIDNQVKIRGFRIELGEIEAIVSQHPQVQAAAVIVREDTPGDKRLVAYITAQPSATPTSNELRQYLKAKLPEYMVPSAYVLLETLPLTPSGKLDRRALPEPSDRSSSDTIVLPRNPVELKLTQIWSKILKLDLVGVKDNFFDLGGHSLLIPYLMAQIKQAFNQDIPLATLLQNPTIEQLATVVQKDKDVDTKSDSPLLAIGPVGEHPPLFCVPGSGGYSLYLYNLARCLPPDQPFYTFQANYYQQEIVPVTHIEEKAARYIQAIQTVQPQGPYFLAGHSFGGKVAYEMAQQLLDQGEEVALLAILDTTPPGFGKTSDDWDDTQWLIDLVGAMKATFASDLELDVEKLISLAPDAQIQYVLEYVKKFDILPPDADSTYLLHLLQSFMADHKAKYSPQQQVYPVHITLFRSSEIKVEENEFFREVFQDSTFGWSAISGAPVDVQFVPGNHTTMLHFPHVQVLAQKLNTCIQQAKLTTNNGQSAISDF
ncbi:amino acid adenylation domain-containing protein [Aerosakkonemataceae cyanobacterium BLCC-F50]|uniref:Amino acid adenylation domain-containing protein n=1 Tax=Floridaenema flaviceps BLCC-F50 TaxID=3153642 RepID=A0ABV4XL14_9CYAN